jgi:hypothetical protein
MVNISKLNSIIYNARGRAKNAVLSAFSLLSVRVYFIMLALVNTSLWVLAKFVVKTIGEPQIALHYSVDFGINLYGNANNIFIIPLLGFIIIFINFSIIISISRYNQLELRFISHLLLASAVIANIILLAALISIFIVNFR